VSDNGFYSPAAGIPDNPADLTAAAAAWHRPHGIAAATTAGALAGTRPAPRLAALGEVTPLDVAPTVLARAGLAVAEDMPGRVLTALASGVQVPKIVSYGLHRVPDAVPGAGARTAGAELQRLRALGYVSGSAAVTSLARVNLGEILFRRGDFRGAVRELEAVARADPLNQRARLWLARAYTSANRPDDAMRVYDGMVQATVAGADIDALVFLAATDLDLSRGRTRSASERLTRVPPAIARTTAVVVARASVAQAEGRVGDAERLFRAALAEEPARFDALSRLVDLLIGNGRTAEAARVAGEEARRFPESAERQALVGEAALARRRYEEAARAFRAAIALAPDASSVRVELARAELLQGHGDAALEALDAVAGQDADALRGAAYANKGQWADATNAYARAVTEGAASVDLLNALGHAQLQAGRAKDAAATLERSLSIKADQPEIRALLERARRTGTEPLPR